MKKETLLTQVWEIHSTTASQKDAEMIAKALLESRLAACVQITGPIQSCYRWQGTIHQDIEWKLSLKTSQQALDACFSEIRRVHPYETPELIAIPLTRVSADYESWLYEQITMPPKSDSLKRWHLRISGHDSGATSGPLVRILEKEINSINLPTGPKPLSVAFEQVEERLSRFPNVHFEPDGSFVWGATEQGPYFGRLWQLDCMLYDRENRIQYVELKGNCDRTTWEMLIEVLAGVECNPLVVQWIEQGVWVHEWELRKCIE